MTKVIRPKSDYERRGKEIKKYPCQLDNIDYGKPRKARTHNVVLRNTLTGQVFGYKTIEEYLTFDDFIALKEHATFNDYDTWYRACFDVSNKVITEQHPVTRETNEIVGYWSGEKGVVYAINEVVLSKWRIHLKNGEVVDFVESNRVNAVMRLTHEQRRIGIVKIERIAFAVNETTEDTRLPNSIIAEITKLINKGARDLNQAWKNVLELVHTAYHVANVKRPTPDQKGAWSQYEDLLRVGVKALANNRGLSGEWRMSDAAFREQATIKKFDHILKENETTRNHRIFVRVKNIGFDDAEREYEVNSKSLNEVIQTFMTQAKRHGNHVRIEPISQNQIKLVIYVKGVNKMREEQIIRIKDLSV